MMFLISLGLMGTKFVWTLVSIISLYSRVIWAAWRGSLVGLGLNWDCSVVENVLALSMSDVACPFAVFRGDVVPDFLPRRLLEIFQTSASVGSSDSFSSLFCHVMFECSFSLRFSSCVMLFSSVL